MNLITKAIVGGSVGTAVLVAIVAMALSRPNDPIKAPTVKASDSGSPSVQLVTPRDVVATSREEVTGTLYPAKALQLGFEVPGRLWRVLAKKGQKVAEGQVLAQLDPETADAQVAQAEAAVAAALAAADMARDVAQRNEKLSAEGGVSELANKNSAAAARQADAQLLSAKAQLTQAKTTRRRQDLRAPFAGTVIDAPEQVGTTVAVGASLFTLEELDSLTLKTTISERARLSLREGQTVKVTSAAGEASTDAAKIQLILPSADPTTRRLPVEISVPNVDGRFAAHTLVRATLTLGSPIDTQAIPATALVSAGGDHVFVVSAQGAVQRVSVEVIDRGAKEVLVKAPSPLAQVIDNPAADLAEGSLVSSR